MKTPRRPKIFFFAAKGYVPYSGKFSRGPNFRDFRDQDKNAKISTVKYETVKIWTHELLKIFTPCVL